MASIRIVRLVNRTIPQYAWVSSDPVGLAIGLPTWVFDSRVNGMTCSLTGCPVPRPFAN